MLFCLKIDIINKIKRENGESMDSENVEMKQNKKALDIVGMIIISAIIAILNLIVGANEKGLRIFSMCTMMTCIVFYLVIRKIILKEKMVLKNKVDILVLFFMSSTLLPYLFRTYCTQQGTVEFIIKYFFVYAIYLLVTNVVDNKNKINILILVTLLSSIIVAIIGIDVQHHQYLNWLLDKLNLRYTDCVALISSFGYANTVAVYFSFCIFLAMNQIQSANPKWVKIFCGAYIILAFYIVLQTLSRSIFVLLLGALFLYFILYFLPMLLNHKKQLAIVIASGSVAAVLLLAFLFGIGVRVSKPYEVEEAKYQRNFNYSFEPNQEYIIELEVETENYYGTEIQIGILEINSYFNENVLAMETLRAGQKKVDLKFTTTDRLYQIDMVVLNQNNHKISLQKCYIEGKEYPLDYKYLPYQIGQAITMYSANDKSIKQRTDMWKDCLKIAKDSPIIGQGGDTWKKLSQAVQDYPYGMKESHSYFFELLISYGIVGVVLYLTLIIVFNILVIKDCIKTKKNRYDKLSILFGLNLILVHSLCFDFDLSFLVILTIVFVYMGILMYDVREDIKYTKKWDYPVLGFLSVILLILIMANIAQDCLLDKKLKKKIGFYAVYYRYDYINECIMNGENFRETLKEIQTLMKKEPYFYQSETYDVYWQGLLSNMNQLNEKEIAEYISFINKQYRKIKFVTPMYIETVLPRVYTMQSAYSILKNINFTDEKLINEIEELNQIIKDEYEVNKKNIKEQERNGYDEQSINNIMQEYESILNM